MPKNARFHSLKKILYACDALSWSTIKELGWIQQLLESFGTEIEFFNVNETINDLKKEQQSDLDSEKESPIYKTVRSSAVINEIKKEIIKYKPDILVMVPKKYGFWDSLLHTSKTRMMAAGLEIPLLSFPNYSNLSF